MDTNMEYKPPTTESGNPLPLTGYSFSWPAEIYIGYSVEDLLQKFGHRIQNAIRTPLYHGQTGLDDQTMMKKTKWWKFWNRDIREAYKWYTGEVYNDEDIKFSNYINNPNPTVPPSEDPTLAPEHPENSAVKKKIKLPSPRMKPKETLVMDHIKVINTVNDVIKKVNEDIKPGIVYAPYVLQTRTEPNPEYDKFMKKYHRDHSCCPKCGSNHLRTSLIDYILYMDHKEDYKDKNSVYCEECEFNGIRHDLVPKKRKPRLHEHTFELDGGPCTKCGKTVAEMIDEDITNYKKKNEPI